MTMILKSQKQVANSTQIEKPVSRRTALKLLGALSATEPCLFGRSGEATPSSLRPPTAAGESPRRVAPDDVFAMQGNRIITEEEHLGIINGCLTAGVNYRDVGTISGLYAPPYASSDFLLELRLFGEKVRTTEYDWRPTKSAAKAHWAESPFPHPPSS